MNPYVYLVIGIAWLASVIGVGIWQREDGKTVERSAWQGRENAELVAANNTIVEMTAEARARERANAEAVAAISADFQRRLRDARALSVRDAVAARDGSLRLFDHAGTCGPDQDRSAKAGAGAGRRDGQAGCELSRQAAEFLLGLANEADDVVRQLDACQALVVSDRDSNNASAHN